jgi:FkbM family methyltransferase
MTLKRTVAEAAVATLNGAAKIAGRRFYRLYLDDINRRFNDVAEMSISLRDRTIKFACPNQLTQWRAKTLLTKEPATIAWIDGFAPGSVMWDIGANVGIYSLYAAATRQARVLAFEPNPANYALLCGNIAINRLGDAISPFGIALSESRGIGSLAMSTMEPGGAFSRFAHEKTAAAQTKLACLSYSIDAFIDEFSPLFPEHIKIDVDGIEDRIVAGGQRTLSDPRLKSISVELDDRDPQQAEAVQSMLIDCGLQFKGRHRSPFFADSPAQNYHFAR